MMKSCFNPQSHEFRPRAPPAAINLLTIGSTRALSVPLDAEPSGPMMGDTIVIIIFVIIIA